MKVANSEQAQKLKDNEDLLKRMNKGLERKIANKEQEIKNVDALYDKKIEHAKIGGEEDFVSSIDRNQQRIVSESVQFEDKIKGYQDRLKKAREAVDLEETSVKTGHMARIEDMKTENEQNYQDQFFNTTVASEEMQNSTKDALQDISAKSRLERSALESKASYEVNALTTDLNDKNVNIEKTFRDKLVNDIRVHTAEVNRQREELKNVMQVEADKNKRLSTEKARVNTEQLSYQDKHQLEMLKQRDADFKVRYQNMVKEHETILKDIASRLDADVKKMVENTSVEKNTLKARENDPFYRVETLNPKMTEDLKTVTVAIPVSEFEKENVHLSAQGRNIKITLSRKYNESLTEKDGSLNKSTRSELFSKSMNSVDLLSPKDIVQNYSDGVLTFKINKA